MKNIEFEKSYEPLSFNIEFDKPRLIATLEAYEKKRLRLKHEALAKAKKETIRKFRELNKTEY